MSVDQREEASKVERASTSGRTKADRITVGLIPKVRAQLDALVDATTFSVTDVVNRAITIYHLINTSQQDGFELVLRHRETGKERVVEII